MTSLIDSVPAEVVEKARRVELLSLDVDGVLTDGHLYYSEAGIEAKAFSTQDGAAVKMLIESGLPVAIITGRTSELVARRAAELGIEHLYQGAEDKTEALAELARTTAIDAANMAHAGDDLPDLPLFNRVGFCVAVPEAHPVILERADYVTTAPAGLGAVRELCQLLLEARGDWDSALLRFDR
jgi:3-deoxy-D-manno-octulosonate 8-phosphate phosphatase (KDO 8-P phosphatase)